MKYHALVVILKKEQNLKLSSAALYGFNINFCDTDVSISHLYRIFAQNMSISPISSKGQQK